MAGGKARTLVVEALLAMVLASCATAVSLEWSTSTSTSTSMPAAPAAPAPPSESASPETTWERTPEPAPDVEPEPQPEPEPEAQAEAPGGSLARGDRGSEVRALQERLRALHYDPGAADGAFGEATHYAVIAFQKVHGLEPDGVAGAAVSAALADPTSPEPRQPSGEANRVEVDLASQLLFVYRGDSLLLISHVSTGSGETFCDGGPCRRAVTPTGEFRFLWQVAGWDVGPLGGLYNPVYFTADGVAVHGALSVPLHPASHGCVRIPMHTAERFPDLVRLGDAVYVVAGA